MAVGPHIWPEALPVPGVRIGTACAGIKNRKKDDLTLFELCSGTKVSGVFTRNRFCAEPVKICREHLRQGNVRYLLINSGNANACTGEPGYQAALSTCQALAAETGVSPESVLPFSTGVIGVVLPAEKINTVLAEVIGDLSEAHWDKAARAIMTTDTRPKLRSKKIDIDGSFITITGIAKGAGMIKPNMGTMLAYLACDAKLSQSVCDELVRYCANKSFNRITIDGDTSTNDSFMLMATGASPAKEINSDSDQNFLKLREALTALCQELALEIVRDAEGATKCVEVEVKGGKSTAECLQVAYAICHSPLVKTALFASDPNWGRIVAAIGYAGIEDLDASRVSVWIDDVAIVSRGGRDSSYTEERGQAVFNKEEIKITVELGRGEFVDTLWTSDLSHEYVRINAEYRS